MAPAFRLGAPLAAAAAAAILAVNTPLLADSAPATRVTIRGSGSQVTIERTPAGAHAARPKAARRLSGNELVDEIARQTAAGLPDAQVVEGLRARQSELPPVIGSSDLLRLRQAGAGDALIRYLASVSAVEIGPTSDDRGATSAAPMPLAPELTPGFAQGEAYYGYGGYAGYPIYGAQRLRGHRHPVHHPGPHPMPVRHPTIPVRRPPR